MPISPSRMLGLAAPAALVLAQFDVARSEKAFVVSVAGLAASPGSEAVSGWVQTRLSPNE